MSIAEIVEKDLSRARGKYGDGAPLMYLNSFILRLPDERFNRGYLRQYFDEASWRTLHKDLPNYDLTGFSELFKTQTPKEFYAAVDRAIEECKISIDDICKLQRRDKIALCNLVLPVFIKLREAGYNRKDLGFSLNL